MKPTLKALARWILGIADPVWDATDPRASAGTFLRQASALAGASTINQCAGCSQAFVAQPGDRCHRCDPEQLAQVVRPEGARLAGSIAKAVAALEPSRATPSYRVVSFPASGGSR